MPLTVQAVLAAATLDVTLGALQRREPIQRDPRAFGGADGLRFSHGLIRDAAYRFLPKETRSELHERLALWLDRAAEQPLGEQEEVVGYHLEHARGWRGASLRWTSRLQLWTDPDWGLHR